MVVRKEIKRTTRQEIAPGVTLNSGPYKGAIVRSVVRSNGWVYLAYPEGYTGPFREEPIRVNCLQLEERRIITNMLTVEELFQGNPTLYTENVIASQETQGRSKELVLRVTVNAQSFAVDAMYHVYDLKQLPDRQILLITSDLQVAIDKYNEI